jgi:hypothetical protein
MTGGITGRDMAGYKWKCSSLVRSYFVAGTDSRNRDKVLKDDARCSYN